MTLTEALSQAVTTCDHPIEEEGGILLMHPVDRNFKFIKLRNQNTGTSVAPVLWTADRNEYAAQVLPLFKEGWRHYASFHTHPRFVPFPSNIDLNELFPGFSINYIYSQRTQEVTQWDYIKPDTASGDSAAFQLENAYQFSPSFKQLNLLNITDNE